MHFSSRQCSPHVLSPLRCTASSDEKTSRTIVLGLTRCLAKQANTRLAEDRMMTATLSHEFGNAVLKDDVRKKSDDAKDLRRMHRVWRCTSCFAQTLKRQQRLKSRFGHGWGALVRIVRRALHASNGIAGGRFRQCESSSADAAYSSGPSRPSNCDASSNCSTNIQPSP